MGRGKAQGFAEKRMLPDEDMARIRGLRAHGDGLAGRLATASRRGYWSGHREVKRGGESIVARHVDADDDMVALRVRAIAREVGWHGLAGPPEWPCD